jgi:cyclophilin family peptidyl-prolyl cis-trans isomerase
VLRACGARWNILPRVLGRLARSRYAFPAAIVAIAAIAGIVVLIAQSGGEDGGGGSERASCEEVAAPAPKEVEGIERPRGRLDAGTTYTATVATNCGTFTIELDSEESPRTSASFVSLARDGFYDGLGFHRIAPGFVIQGGDPNGDGTGGPGYKTRDRPSDDVVYSEGVVAMAKGGAEAAGTAGSQFFVVTAADAGLPADYAVLGKIVRGLDVVKRIEAQAAPDTPQQGGPPADPVVMESVEISEAEDAAQ